MSSPPQADARWAYFLDFDGTLVPYHPRPDQVVVEPTLRELLHALRARCSGALAIVSGRRRDDLERRIGLPGLHVAGQHGADLATAMRGAGERDLARVMERIAAQLAPLLSAHPDLLLENKGMTLALHYRSAPELRDACDDAVREASARFLGDVEILQGNHIFEVKPTACDKGTAIAAFMEQAPFAGRRPVVIGDDTNDEPALAAANDLGGISIRVGTEESCARYRLADYAAVCRWLAALASVPAP